MDGTQVFGKFFDSLFNKHKAIRRLMVVVVLYLIVWACVTVLPKLEGGDAVNGLALVIGLLTPILVFYKWDRSKDKDK